MAYQPFEKYSMINDVVKPGMMAPQGRPISTPPPTTPMNPALAGISRSNFNPIGIGGAINAGARPSMPPPPLSQVNPSVLRPQPIVPQPGNIPPGGGWTGPIQQPPQLPPNPLLNRAAQGTMQRYGMGNYE